MAISITLAQLMERSRDRADMTSSQFISDEELITYINNSYAELYDILVSRFEDYYFTQLDFAISSGNTYALPSDFYKLVGLDFKISSNEYLPLQRYNFANRNENPLRRNYTNRDVKYRITGNNVRIEPQDNAPGDYRMYYIPCYTPLVDETDILDGINGFDEYIVVDVARKMLQKEESNTTDLENEKTLLVRRIEAMAQTRDSGMPDTISDVSIYRNYWEY